ncbi:MAG: hypothetical protein WAJ94_08890 [Candidatus Cybelea sp.]
MSGTATRLLLSALGLGLLCAGFTACNGSAPSDDDVLKHVLAINTCYARMYVKQSAAALAQRRAFAGSKDPMAVPTPTYDLSGLRACFIARASRQRLNDRLRKHPAILALGRSCEKYVALESDDATVAYAKCIRDGMPAALDSAQ